MAVYKDMLVNLDFNPFQRCHTSSPSVFFDDLTDLFIKEKKETIEVKTANQYESSLAKFSTYLGSNFRA